ncbi:MAG: NCS2 family permease [Chlamydiales bacterium]|nr:NCS2 family permease [Chlamydiales bacterium]
MRAALYNFFQLEQHKTNIRTELLAGLTTFSTMAYIIVVNPIIMKVAGMDFGAVMVATILAASLATLIMGLYANYPFALAPGMGLNAFFAYTLVIDQQLPWQIALGACFWAGFFFLLLNVLGVRQLILEAIPETLRVTLTAGIGLFLAFIALNNLHVVVSHPETLVTVGDLRSPEILLAALGLITSCILIALGYRGAILISILLVWVVGLITGNAEWQGIFALPPDISPTFMQLELFDALKPEYLGTVLTFAFIAIFDAAGTIAGLAEQGNFLDKDKKLPRVRRVFVADAIGTMVGSAVGTSPMTTYLESGAGVTAGGRTGLVAVVVAVLFLLSLFLAPLIASIPFYATASALIIIGAQMLVPLNRVNFDDVTEYIPGFMVLIIIPLTFSISTGIALGLILFPIMKVLTGRVKEVHWLVWILAALFILKFSL